MYSICRRPISVPRQVDKRHQFIRRSHGAASQDLRTQGIHQTPAEPPNQFLPRRRPRRLVTPHREHVIQRVAIDDPAPKESVVLPQARHNCKTVYLQCASNQHNDSDQYSFIQPVTPHTHTPANPYDGRDRGTIEGSNPRASEQKTRERKPAGRADAD